MAKSRRGLSMIELKAVIVIITVALSLYLPAVTRSREAARRSQCMNNLKQFGLALHNYQDAHNVLVPGRIWGKGCGTAPENTCQDTPWSMMLLPMMEQRMMHDSFNFELGSIGPWGEGLVANSTVNATIMSSFMCPSQPGPSVTRPYFSTKPVENLRHFEMPGEYLSTDLEGIELARANYAVNWGNTNWGQTDIADREDGAYRQSPFGHFGNLRIDDIQDGLSTTILISEVTYGAPSDVRGVRALTLAGASNYNASFLPNQFIHLYKLADAKSGDRLAHPSLCVSEPNRMTCTGVDDKNGSFSGAKSGHPGGLQALFGDGSVRFIRNLIDAQVWLGLHSIDGGEVVTNGRL